MVWRGRSPPTAAGPQVIPPRLDGVTWERDGCRVVGAVRCHVWAGGGARCAAPFAGTAREWRVRALCAKAMEDTSQQSAKRGRWRIGFCHAGTREWQVM